MNTHVVIYLKCLPQICTKMNDFKFDFSKIFWGGAHRAPSPDPSPRFFLGLRPRFGLRPQFSGASRLRLGRFAPSIRAPPSTFGRRTWFGPPKINCWIRHWVRLFLLMHYDFLFVSYVYTMNLIMHGGISQFQTPFLVLEMLRVRTFFKLLWCCLQII